MTTNNAICILTTGGTIDKVYFDANSKFEVGEPVIKQIFDEALVKIDYRVQALFQKDSLELNDSDREVIRQTVLNCPEDLILITHGTDTMTTTAEFLKDIPNKTVVITGALSPARFRSTDAIFNIGLALGALQSITPGVYITMNGQVFAADKVRKNLELKQFVAL